MRQALTWIVPAALAAAAWLAWLGWDESGTYAAWQVVGSAVSLVVVVALATLVFRDPGQVALAATAGYAIACAGTATTDDGSGLSDIGLALLVIGVGAASFAVAFGTREVRARQQGDRPYP
ncbi:hypothetical protein GEV29_07155 [Aeromicrobium sp. SMF47]|uniref:hypothetical protein n=1 Tax=Aeromicrobium TaxID=2040 RepID=UPI00129E713C|nr:MULTISPECIES: hypothetical protein [Aeromicrobium]MRJ76309.1 hypothetical protein [Aeromicrobium yanjiei]MRK00659.1 hypothetical protein [Aeromicrobium sp. S22]